MINTKMFAGALVAAGLMAACGGELENQGGEKDGTGVTESAVIQTLATRGAFEPITCDMDYYKRTYYVGDIKVVEQCRLAIPFANQYRAGASLTFSANFDMYIMPDGLAYNGILEGAQAAYTGTANGMVTFQGGQQVAPSGVYGSAKILGGLLATDTCLITGVTSTSTPIWKACAGGTHASFTSNMGYASCNTVASITCP